MQRFSIFVKFKGRRANAIETHYWKFKLKDYKSYIVYINQNKIKSSSLSRK